MGLKNRNMAVAEKRILSKYSGDETFKENVRSNNTYRPSED